MALTDKALQQNQTQIDTLIESISSGNAQGALWALLNERAVQLKLERESLLIEQRRLRESMAPLEEHFDSEVFQSILTNFMELAAEAEPDELQRLLRFTVRRIEWMPDSAHRLQLYQLAKPNCLPSASAGRQWLQTHVSFGGAEGIRTPDLFRAREARSQLRHSPNSPLAQQVPFYRLGNHAASVVKAPLKSRRSESVPSV